MAFTKVGTLSAGDVITSAGVNSGFAAWTTYSPTYANLIVGNGTVIAKYTQAGRITFVKWQFTLGSTSTYGTNPTVSLPVAMADTAGLFFQGGFADTSAGAYYQNQAIYASSTTVLLYAVATGGTYASFTPSTGLIPFSWASTDAAWFTMVYEGVS